jgi:2-deoxy-D-gluconate 3-dehydrogenase
MSLFDLSGRVAAVTGGNGGIGLGMAEGMAGAGASILVVGRNPEKNVAAVETLRGLGAKAEFFKMDVTEANAGADMVAAAESAFGRLDILVNNAGGNIRKRPEDLSPEEFRWVLETNLTSAFLCSQAAYPAMQRAGGGKIINIGSMYSLFGAPAVAAYAVSKGGIVQMTKSLAAAWAADKIQVNAVLPGWIDTELTRRAREEIDGLYERQLARIPGGRWGTPRDHAGVAVFLASAASDYVTGTSIPVDGGFSISG